MDYESKALTALVGRTIAELRAAKGLSQGQLGALAGLTDEGLRLIELGQSAPKMTTLWRIAKALGESPQKLLPTNRQVVMKANVIRKTGIRCFTQTTLDLQERSPEQMADDVNRRKQPAA